LRDFLRFRHEDVKDASHEGFCHSNHSHLAQKLLCRPIAWRSDIRVAWPAPPATQRTDLWSLSVSCVSGA